MPWLTAGAESFSEELNQTLARALFRSASHSYNTSSVATIVKVDEKRGSFGPEFKMGIDASGKATKTPVGHSENDQWGGGVRNPTKALSSLPGLCTSGKEIASALRKLLDENKDCYMRCLSSFGSMDGKAGPNESDLAEARVVMASARRVEYKHRVFDPLLPTTV
jgi:hypothetical protein